MQRFGCKWTGITLSKAQLKEAQQRVKAAGLDGRISLLFCDYRDIPGTAAFDKVVSCEMVEAVGQEHLGTYFRAIGAALKTGGTAVLQVRYQSGNQCRCHASLSNRRNPVAHGKTVVYPRCLP